MGEVTTTDFFLPWTTERWAPPGPDASEEATPPVRNAFFVLSCVAPGSFVGWGASILAKSANMSDSLFFIAAPRYLSRRRTAAGATRLLKASNAAAIYLAWVGNREHGQRTSANKE